MVSIDHTLCPKCGKEASTKKQVYEIFGFRTRKSGNGETLPQSNCKNCRARIQRLRKRLGLQSSRI